MSDEPLNDEPRIDLAAMAPAVPFVGVGLVLLGARTVVYGLAEGPALVALAGAVIVALGLALAWIGLRRARRSLD